MQLDKDFLGPDPRRNDFPGFTLVELLVVIVILVMAAVMAVPNFSRSVAQLELRRAAEDLAYTIRYGQMRAMTKGRVLRLQVDTQGYWMEENRAMPQEKTSSAANQVFARIRDKWGRTVPFPREITLAQETQPIIFSPDGRMTQESFRLCRLQNCLVVSTGVQRGRVKIIDGQGAENHESP